MTIPCQKGPSRPVGEQATSVQALGSGTDLDLMDLCQCSGCGEYRSTAALGMAHACHRAEDGTREEGGTFQ